jgi:tetratricopeptide (TPR) repeat protein
VLSEEALIVLMAFGACGLLALGVAELLWPTRRRRPGPRPRPEPAPAPIEPAVETSDVPPPVEPPAGPDPTASRPPRVHRTSALARHRLVRGRSPYVRRAPASDGTGASHPGVAVAEAVVPPPGPAVLEQCVALHQAGRHAEAIALGMAEVQRTDPTQSPDGQRTVALWSVIALAHQALGEHAEARAALESAIDAAPEAARPEYTRRLADLASEVARTLVADADAQKRADSEERVTLLRQATEWMKCATAASPDDDAVTALAADAQARQWSAYERTVVALVHRQEFRAARRLLREALADPLVPGAHVERFHELFSTTFSGEIGQLTAQALRDAQDGRETDAVAALERVESLLERLSDEVLSPERREEVSRRLSWGYHRLGERRLEAGDAEGALEPLLRVLDHEVDAERRRELHARLVGALDTVTDARGAVVRDLTRHGDRDAARAHCEALSALLQAAADRGVPPADLAGVVAQVQRLLEGLGR